MVRGKDSRRAGGQYSQQADVCQNCSRYEKARVHSRLEALQGQNKESKNTVQKTKDRSKKTGTGRVVCKFFKELDDVLGPRPTSQPPNMYESSATDVTPENPRSSEDEMYTSDGKLLFFKVSMLGNKKNPSQQDQTCCNRSCIHAYIQSQITSQ